MCFYHFGEKKELKKKKQFVNFLLSKYILKFEHMGPETKFKGRNYVNTSYNFKEVRD